MQSLESLMNEALKKMDVAEEFQNVKLITKDDESSAAFIRNMLDDEDYSLPSSQPKLVEFAKARAKHSAVTFLIGLVFSQFMNLFSSLHEIISDDASQDGASQFDNRRINQRLWLITSLYHDKAY